jgi:hypothetical protein
MVIYRLIYLRIFNKSNITGITSEAEIDYHSGDFIYGF